MSDEKGRRDLTPSESRSDVSPLEGGVTEVPGADSSSADRFSSGPRTHVPGLTEERAAQVVRQSGSARNWAFLAVLFVALFIPVYWFYDIGIPAVGAEGRLAREAEVQLVTDVSRGYDLYLANCARCHGEDGQGGIGPPLNDQAKLHNALTPDGQAGSGHFNPIYLHRVMEVGGRYICGDPESLMPAWLQPAGPLNYREVEEIVAWMVASNEIEFTYDPAAHGEVAADHSEPRTVRGWRDPDFQPAPDAPTPPPCWRNPSGVIGGTAPGGAEAAAEEALTVDQPGTVEEPRVVSLEMTASLQFTDTEGNRVLALPVAPGETVTFEVDNTAGFDHNFYIGTPDELSVPGAVTEVGIPTYTSGVETVTWTVPDDPVGLQFACTVPGHYEPMHGDFVVAE
jgi:mono/diheme cytochrome c family protein